jgi:hypothetical protein
MKLLARGGGTGLVGGDEVGGRSSFAFGVMGPLESCALRRLARIWRREALDMAFGGSFRFEGSGRIGGILRGAWGDVVDFAGDIF